LEHENAVTSGKPTPIATSQQMPEPTAAESSASSYNNIAGIVEGGGGKKKKKKKRRANQQQMQQREEANAILEARAETRRMASSAEAVDVPSSMAAEAPVVPTDSSAAFGIAQKLAAAHLRGDKDDVIESAMADAAAGESFVRRVFCLLIS
jgi:hypothetical protein